jgi:WD40 repeat protein/serine/threonine protein kinase
VPAKFECKNRGQILSIAHREENAMSVSSSERDPVEELAEEFLARCRRGERPALSEYSNRYPQWAEKIRSLFPLLIDMEAARPAAQEGPNTGDALIGPEQKLERLGDYQVLREVGRGGMGIVYEAVQVSLGRHVALKVLPQHALLDPRHLKRFQREAKAAARLHHTNIVPVYCVGEESGLHYYVMQFIQGQSLDAVLAELRRRNEQPGSNGERHDLPLRIAPEVSAAAVAQSLLSGRFRAGPTSEGRQPPDSAKSQGADARRSPGSDTSIHLPGQSADSTLSDTGRAYWQSVAHVGVQVAEALAYASSQAIVHRDIKPSNLLLDTKGTVWVTDFGLAKTADSEDLTHTGDVVGTLRYMPPERLQGKSDPPGDVYSLGITLYELLTLRTAFVDSDRARLMRRVAQEEPPRPRKLDRRIPRDLETIVLKAIEKEPTQRYRNAAEMAEDLRRFLASRPVRARPIGVLEQLVKWAKRRPAVAALTAAVLVLLAAVAGIASVGYVRTRASEHELRQHLYAAKINLMQQAWDINQVMHLRALLAETADYPDRGFEWYYWQRQCHLERHTLIGHHAQVWAVSWSPDGKFLASASMDGTVRVWQAAGGHELVALKVRNPVNSVSWSPDGKQLVTGSDDGTAKVWNATDGRELFVLKGHTNGVGPVSWSPNGKWLATGGAGGTAKIWDAEDGRELRTLKGHTSQVRSVSWSPDGERLATGCDSGTAKVWEAVDGHELLMLEAHTQIVTSVAWSPDGKWLATGSNDGTAKVWDAADGRELLLLKGHTKIVSSVSWSPDGKRLATGSTDGTVKVWDAADGRELFLLKGHTSYVRSVSWSPDGKWLATGSLDGTAKIWDAAGDRGRITVQEHTQGVSSLSWSPDGKLLATASGDGAAKVWDTAEGRELFPLQGHTDAVDSVCWSPDGKRLATGSFDGTAKLWEVTGRRPLLTLQGRRVCWSADGTQLATVCEGGTAKVWDARDGRPLDNLKGHGSALSAASWSPDSKRLATASADGTAIVWDVARKQKLDLLQGHRGTISCMSWSPDNRRLATGCDDTTAKVWDTADGEALLTLKGHTGKVHSVCWSPDGKRLATGSDDGTVKVWDGSGGRELLTYTGAVTSLSWTPDGKGLAMGSANGTVKVWEAASLQAVQEWTRQDRALDELLARNAFRGLQAQGFIQTWLLLLPIRFASKESGAQALDRQQLFEEAKLRPRPGQRVWVEGRELVWQEHHSPEPTVDFNAVLGRKTEFSIAYAVCYVESDRTRADIWLQVGSDDQAKVYLNGQDIRQRRLPGPLDQLDTVGPYTLQQGTNVLVFKVVNESLNWQGCIRLVDEAGRPAQGICVKLTPE